MRLPVVRRSTADRLLERSRELGKRNKSLKERNQALKQRNQALKERSRALRERVRTLHRELSELRAKLRRESGSDLNYVFIVTYGRTGSTLLMGVLNSLPGYLIRGENFDAAYRLFQFHQAMTLSKTRWRRKRTRLVTHPFFGAGDFPEGASLASCRRLLVRTVFRPDPDTRVVGFKEIRWNQPDVQAYMEWLQEMLPGARFVLNTRDLDDVNRSGMWAEGDFRDEIAERHATVLSLEQELGASAYRVHYDDYITEPTRLRDLVEWLGEEWDEASVLRVMETEHSVLNRTWSGRQLRSEKQDSPEGAPDAQA